MRTSVAIVWTLLSFSAIADAAKFEHGGHTKFNLTGQTYPDNSLLRDLLGSDSVDLQGELRLNLELRKEQWSLEAGYQLIGLHGDSLKLASAFAFGDRLPGDDRRLFDLTSIINDSRETAFLQRLDRFWIGHSSEKAVVRFGRQALSWGNGFFYAPMDLVNPFDPATIDSEYKAGDDMLYLQYLRDNSDDMQLALVIRRNPLNGDVESGQATLAFKYHGFAGDYEYDILIGESYDDNVYGAGAARAIGGANWSADLVVTNADSDTYFQFVTNLSYSWMFADRNMTGVLEYHHNGAGQRSARYAPMDLAANPALLASLARRQSYTLGRNYVAGSVTIEMTPLWNLTPVLLANVEDPSALLQLTSSYSLSDDASLLGSINIPIGGNGTEFGGIDAGIPNRYLSTDAGLFVQVAWYF